MTDQCINGERLAIIDPIFVANDVLYTDEAPILKQKRRYDSVIPVYLANFLYGADSATVEHVSNTFEQALLSFDEKAAVLALFDSISALDVRHQPFINSALERINEIDPDINDRLVQIAVAKYPNENHFNTRFPLAVLLSFIPSERLKPKTTRLLNWSEKNAISSADITCEQQVVYNACPAAEERSLKAMSDGGYMILATDGADVDAGILMKMWGKPLGIITRTLKIGNHYTIPGSIVAPMLGQTRDYVKKTFFEGIRKEGLPTTRLTFVLQRMLTGKDATIVLEQARQELTKKDNKVPTLPSGVRPIDYYMALREDN